MRPTVSLALAALVAVSASAVACSAPLQEDEAGSGEAAVGTKNLTANDFGLEEKEIVLTLDDGPVRPDAVKVVSTAGDRTLIKITLHEGRNHIVRRTMEAVGHPVRRLSRTGIGPVRLGTLRTGEVRELTRSELGGLLDLTGG